MGRVSGKVAIVTGAARGLGAASARRLIEEGAKVMLTDLEDQENKVAAQQLGSNARFMYQDVTSEAGWKQVLSETEAAFGPISVLVNNAGICPSCPLETMEEADYRHVIDVNQVSVFLGMKSALPSMKRAGGGSIINISSTMGLVATQNVVAYIASKFAVRGMTKSAAIELASHNIRVNSIHPGMIRTRLTVPRPGYEEILAGLARATPAARLGEPDEIANVVLMLASDESRFSTGAEFVVDGGATCM